MLNRQNRCVDAKLPLREGSGNGIARLGDLQRREPDLDLVGPRRPAGARMHALA